MTDGSFANEGWFLKGSSGCKIWLIMYLEESKIRILQWDGVWQGLLGMDTSGLRYLSILFNWITGLDVLYARARLTTLATSSINYSFLKSVMSEPTLVSCVGYEPLYTPR